MTGPVIECRGIGYRAGDRLILDSVDLTVRKGDFYAVIGPNGGGKTTLLKIILGLLQPSEGIVRVFGTSPRKGRAGIGYVPQYRTFDFQYPITVEEMVLSGRLSHIPGVTRRYTERDRETVRETLKQLGISRLKDRELRRLSGGEQQRAIIARALVGEPKLLILDEPLVYVDVPTEERIFDLFAELESRLTILVVTHDIGAISSHVTRVACLNSKMYTHDTAEITGDMLAAAYHCPVDLIAHGVPHRVFRDHREEP
jgi:zinc transport system ATP-binding protein